MSELPRRIQRAVVLATVAVLCSAASAQATPLSATCSSFGNTLAGAHNGDTIVLTGLCTGAQAHFTLPAGVSGLTIEGASTGTNGFDGTGVAAPALVSDAGGTDGLTLSNLTFENYSSQNAVRLNSVTTTASNPFTFSGDTFSNDSAPSGANGDGGGLSLTLDPGTCSFSGPAVTLSGSTFSHNSAPGSGLGGTDLAGGGGAAYLDIECGTNAPTVSVTNNIFDHNTLNASGDAEGGGLWLGEQGRHNTGIPPLALTQSGNAFSNNSITGSGSNFSGGGEFSAGAIISSDRDQFLNNSLPGPSDATVDSEGSAFSSLIGGGCPGVISSATDLVAAGNSIGAASGSGTGDGVEGTIHPYCSAGGSYDLTLINSTVTGNVAAGAETDAVAGIDAAAGDHLHMKNSIVYGNSGGTQIDGFGTYSADHSDVCDFPPNSTNPFAGTGNICKEPKLVNASTGDVHETSLSPTVDAGSNTDAVGIDTDVYGNHRIQPGQVGAAPVVDIGADELHVATPTVTDCSTLQTTLDAAQPGDVITLDALCTNANSGASNGSFDLNSNGVTLQGASTGTNGFDGPGATSSALQAVGSGVVLRNLTFENYNLSSGPTVSLDAHRGALPVLDRNRFINNTSTNLSILGAALQIEGSDPACQYSGALTISNSVFSGNHAVDTETNTGNFAFGAGAAISMPCTAPHTANLNIVGNSFTGNGISTPGAQAYGAGLYAADSLNGQLHAQQSKNVFTNNSITAAGTASSSYNGAGEWLASVNLTDTGDRFVKNSLPGPAAASASSEGAGLGVVRAACGSPPSSITATANLRNVVSAGNVIGAPSSGGSVEGAGLYAGGCLAKQGSNGFHLTLINSTVAGNSGPGGASGIDGESGDTLVLQNSIVNGDTGTGASEIEGFGAGITAAFSDVCATGSSTTPFAGSGNICKAPRLVNTSNGDVYETASSPTIDAGSNTLVPAGLTQDFYGLPRIVATRSCTAKVDMGAAEFQTHASPCPPPVTPRTVFRRAKAKGKGVAVTLSCIRHATGPCRGKISLKTIVHRPKGSHKGPKKKTSGVGSKSYAVRSGGKKTYVVALSNTGRKLLSQHGKLTVTVVVVQSVGGKKIVIAKHKLTIETPHKKKK